MRIGGMFPQRSSVVRDLLTIDSWLTLFAYSFSLRIRVSGDCSMTECLPFFCICMGRLRFQIFYMYLCSSTFYHVFWDPTLWYILGFKLSTYCNESLFIIYFNSFSLQHFFFFSFKKNVMVYFEMHLFVLNDLYSQYDLYA